MMPNVNQMRLFYDWPIDGGHDEKCVRTHGSFLNF